MAANQKFILEFITKGIDGIDKAAQGVDQLKGKVNGLTTALLGVSFGAFIKGAIDSADRLSDFSDATNISIASLSALEAAMNAAGGSGKNLEKSVNAFYAAIENANSGSLAAREAFDQVGVSLNDLKTLSETDILNKTLEGLAKLPQNASTAAVAAQLLSRSWRSINNQALLDALDPEKYAENEAAVKRAAEAAQRLEEAYKALQIGAINAIQPILDLFGEQELSAKNAETIIKAVGIALGIAFGASVISNIIAIGKAIAGLNTILKANAVIQAGIVALQGPKGWAILAGAAAAAGVAVYGLNKMLDENAAAAEAVKNNSAEAAKEVDRLAKQYPAATGEKRAGLTQATPQAGNANRRQELDARQKAVLDSEKRIAESAEEVKRLAALKGATDLEKIAADSAAEIAKARLEIYSKENLSKEQKDKEFAAKSREIGAKAELERADVLDRQAKQVKALTSEFEKQQLLSLSRLDLETELVGKSEQEAQLLRAQRQLAMDYMAEQERLIAQRENLGRNEQAQIDKINQLIAQNAEAYGRSAEALTKSVTANQSALLIEKDRLANIERITQAYEQQQRVQQTLGDAQRSLIEQQKDIEFETAQLGRSPAERQLEQIKENARKAALAASRAFAAAFDDAGDGLTPERAAELAAGLKKIEDGYAGITKRQIENLEKSRTFSQGWKDAFNQYKDDATNAATQAATYFNTFTRGFEDAIVRFVQTGKLSFKDLANSIIADFVRIQARQIALGLFGGGGKDGGGIFSFLFGGARALGGPVAANMPYLVGERGPELFMPKSAGTIVPNDKLGMGAGGNTQVVYNINAVDAASFRQMLAREPEFLYAVTERGRGSIPGGRR